MKKPRVPSYRLHKPSGRGVVTIDGRDHYLDGKHGSPESQAHYKRLIAEMMTTGSVVRPTTDTTMAELMDAYLKYADLKYVKGGEKTKEVYSIKYSLSHLKDYLSVSVRDFDQFKLQAVRQSIIDAGYARTEVNRRCRIIVRMFRFGVSRNLAPEGTYRTLSVSLPEFESFPQQIRETAPRTAVDDDTVKATLPLLPPRIAAMVRLQRLCGTRPNEVCIMRGCDIDMTRPVWCYRPHRHKNEHKKKPRLIPIGPKAQEVLKPWLRPDHPEKYFFSPREAMEEFREGQKAKAHVRYHDRRVKKRALRKQPGTCYTPTSYSLVIRREIRRANANGANIPEWCPYQLRHAAATEASLKKGRDAARAFLGHEKIETTAIYDHADWSKASQDKIEF
jgi:integrase